MKTESSLVNSTTARAFLKMWSNKTFVEVESFYDEQYFFTFCFIMLLFFFTSRLEILLPTKLFLALHFISN